MAFCVQAQLGGPAPASSAASAWSLEGALEELLQTNPRAGPNLGATIAARVADKTVALDNPVAQLTAAQAFKR